MDQQNKNRNLFEIKAKNEILKEKSIYICKQEGMFYYFFNFKKITYFFFNFYGIYRINLFEQIHALKYAIKEHKIILLDWKKYNPKYFIKNPIFLTCDFEALVVQKKFTINHLMHFKTGN
jgi:hypothetical protein